LKTYQIIKTVTMTKVVSLALYVKFPTSENSDMDIRSV